MLRAVKQWMQLVDEEQTAKSVSTDYEKIADFFEDLDLYLKRLKVFEGHQIASIPEVGFALAEVLASVFVLCGICTKYTKMRRVGKEIFTKHPHILQYPEDLCLAFTTRNRMTQFAKLT